MEAASEESCCSDSYPSLCLKQLKDKLAVVFMKELHKAFFTETVRDGFERPPRLVVSAMAQEKFSPSKTTKSSESVVKSHQGGNVEEWKINLITTLLVDIEEKCLVLKILDPETMKLFRSMNRGLLGLILENASEYRSQKHCSLAASILMINASKVKIPKEIFTKLLASVEVFSRLNLTTINGVKRSKAYTLLKRHLYGAN